VRRALKTQNRTEQNRTEQNRTEQNRTEQNRTEQNRTEQKQTVVWNTSVIVTTIHFPHSTALPASTRGKHRLLYPLLKFVASQATRPWCSAMSSHISVHAHPLGWDGTIDDRM
jgi:hypothetical protein